MGNMSEIEAVSLMRQPSASRPLTPRQFDVLALLCEGLPNKLIGRRLNISSATVKIHVASILRALGVSSRLQAVIAASSLGLEFRPRGAVTAPRLPDFSRLVADDGDTLRLPAAASGGSLAAVAG